MIEHQPLRRWDEWCGDPRELSRRIASDGGGIDRRAAVGLTNDTRQREVVREGEVAASLGEARRRRDHVEIACMRRLARDGGQSELRYLPELPETSCVECRDPEASVEVDAFDRPRDVMDEQ